MNCFSGNLYKFDLVKKELTLLFNNEDQCIKNGFNSFESLSFSPNGKHMVFFARKADGPHDAGMALYKVFKFLYSQNDNLDKLGHRRGAFEIKHDDTSY